MLVRCIADLFIFFDQIYILSWDLFFATGLLKQDDIHFPINPAFHRVLRFAVRNALYRFLCLQFGLNSVLWTFLKILLTVIDQVQS